MTMPRDKIGGAGIRSEDRLAKRLGARKTAASGALGQKGDMTRDRFRIEAKSTVNASISLKHEWLEKIYSEAFFTSKIPALTVTFTTGDGRPIKRGSWVMVPEDVFNDLTGHGGMK